jgi:TetR/AcrR family transcriptional repressor of nem operon
MSQAGKDRSHARIVASAARLMRERGIEAASVSDVMNDAGLSHGGFYKHFESKEALLRAAMDEAFDEIAQRLRPDLNAAEGPRLRSQFENFYLSDAHRRSPGIGCPIAALSGDIARTASDLKIRFGSGVQRVLGLLARGMPGSATARRARAARRLAMMAGAIMIARASDADTAREVLVACRDVRV